MSRTPGTALDAPPFRTIGASTAYEGEVVFSDLTVTIDRGEFVAILGENGSGKTTLMKALLGLIPLSSGTTELFGVEARHFRDWKQIAYVPQRLLSSGAVPVSVIEMVRSSRIRPGRLLLGSHDRQAADDALRQVGLWERRHDRVDTLSGGQQRRIMIATALAKGSTVFVLDEPTAGVDHDSQVGLARLFESFRAAGSTVLLVTHDLGVFADLATRVIVMDRRAPGSVRYDGPPQPQQVTSEPGWHHSSDLSPLSRPGGILEP